MFTKRKKMQQGKRMVLGMIVPLLLFLTGCTDIEDQVVGKWAEANQSDTMEFFKDGSLILQAKGSSLSGTWSVVDDEERIKFVIEGALGQKIVGTGKYASPAEKNVEYIAINGAGAGGKLFRVKNIADVIIGKWKDEKSSVEFLKNGEVTAHVKEKDGSTKNFSGTWSLGPQGKWVELKMAGKNRTTRVTQGLSASGKRYLKVGRDKFTRDD